MLGSIRTPKQWETYMQHRARFSPDVLKIDAAAETYRICEAIKDQVQDQLRRRGVVLGLSGGIDSSVTAALCVRALGATRVFGVLMPERDSEPDSTRLGRVVAELLKVETILEDIAPILDAAGCYRRRDEFMRLAIPEYGPGYRSKIVLPPAAAASAYNIFSLVVESPSGEQRKVRLSLAAYLGIVAATNMNQR